MDKRNFANQVKGIIVDPAIAAAAIANQTPADRCFLVLFTPRSGSSWLTKIISATQSLGRLEEYINPDFIRVVAENMHSVEPEILLAMLQRWTKTDNGVFSMELRAVDVQMFGETAFFAAFDAGVVIFFLWRDNIVAQGISLYRAITTNRYHSTDAPVSPPDYDAEAICRWIRHILVQENENLALLRGRGLFARFLRYEDIVQDSATTLAIFADAMRVDLTAEQFAAGREGALEKLADEWNRDAEQRFREEQHVFIGRLEAQRLIRQMP